MEPTYIYGIVPTDQHVAVPGDGVSRRPEGIHTLPYRDIAAVVGPSDLDDYRGLAREELVHVLLDHQRVVEQVMRIFPVLPAKFGTVLADERRVTELLTAGYDLFRSRLDRFEGCVQMEVVVQRDLSQAFADFARDDRVAEIGALAAAAGEAEARELRVRAGRMIQAMLEERRIAYRAQLMPRLCECGCEAISNPCMDDSMVLNLALLIDGDGRTRLDELLPRLDEECGGRLTFRCVGPLPPYSFASLEVECPRFSEIDRSRRLLELPETVTAREVKEAFHLQAGRFHPDVNPDVSDGCAAMSDLSSAYALLSRFLQSQTGDGGGACRLDMPSVEKALLFDVVRQQVLADQA